LNYPLSKSVVIATKVSEMQLQQ